MRWTLTTARRGGTAASAAVLCLGVLLTGCGGGSGDNGYVAVGAAGPDGAAPGKPVPPGDGVELFPLKDAEADGKKGKRGRQEEPGPGAGQQREPDSGSGAGERDERDAPGDKAEGDAGDEGGSGGSGGGTDRTAPASPPEGGQGSPSAPGSPTPAPGPAKLVVGEPELAKADRRWCDKVTLELRNTGGKPVTSGTVTFGTHIIGALGVDWATIESERELAVPIAPGQRTEQTWTVCVDSWRVPLGMRVETQDVDVDWA